MERSVFLRADIRPARHLPFDQLTDSRGNNFNQIEQIRSLHIQVIEGILAGDEADAAFCQGLNLFRLTLRLFYQRADSAAVCKQLHFNIAIAQVIEQVGNIHQHLIGPAFTWLVDMENNFIFFDGLAFHTPVLSQSDKAPIALTGLFLG